MPEIRVDFGGFVVLSLEEVWPSGPPARVDARAIAEEMRQAGIDGLLHEWGLSDRLEVDVTVIPDPPPHNPSQGELPVTVPTVDRITRASAF